MKKKQCVHTENSFLFGISSFVIKSILPSHIEFGKKNKKMKKNCLNFS